MPLRTYFCDKTEVVSGTYDRKNRHAVFPPDSIPATGEPRMTIFESRTPDTHTWHEEQEEEKFQKRLSKTRTESMIHSEDSDRRESRVMCPVPLTVRGTQTLVSFAPLAFKLFYAARQNAVLRRSSFPSP